MKKNNSFIIVILMIISNAIYGQTSTETFETESLGSTDFTDNGVIFNVISHTSTFDIAIFPGTGWNGTANDNRYIDNTGYVAPFASFSIKSTNNLFKVNRFWIFLSDGSLNQNISGTLTVTGKLNGVTKFTQTKTAGFATSLGSTNGFTLIDLTNLNGQNYSNIIIDQLQITLGGAYTYASFDAFTWVKDSGVVLAAIDIKNWESNFQIYPNPTSDFINFKNVESIEKVEIYDVSGKLLISSESSVKVDVSKLGKGTYFIKLKTIKGILDSKFIKN